MRRWQGLWHQKIVTVRGAEAESQRESHTEGADSKYHFRKSRLWVLERFEGTEEKGKGNRNLKK